MISATSQNFLYHNMSRLIHSAMSQTILRQYIMSGTSDHNLALLTKLPGIEVLEFLPVTRHKLAMNLVTSQTVLYHNMSGLFQH